MNILTQNMILASWGMVDPTNPPSGSVEKFQQSAKATSIDFSFVNDNPWIWGPIGMICGLLISAILFKGLIVGGARIGFAGNNPEAVKAGAAEVKHALISTVMISVGATLIGSIVGVIVGFVK